MPSPKKIKVNGSHPNFGKQVTAKLSGSKNGVVPAKSALKRPAPKSAPKTVSNPKALPAGIPQKPRVSFANTQGQSLTAVKTIPRIGGSPWPTKRKTPPVSIAAYQKMLAKRDKYKYRLAALGNEKSGHVKASFCGLGKCPPPRPKAVVDKEIRETKVSLNALETSIARQKKTILDYQKTH